MVALHIPTYSREARKGEYAKEEINKAVQNRRALYKMLEPYRVHLLSGHEHYNENYVLSDNLFEHVHAALCGIFWQAPYNSDGAPLGYAVYEYNGDSVQWYYKVTGRNKNFQMNVYTANADKHQPNAIIANVWNYDPAWKVCWYEDGKKMGEMKQYTGWDPATVDYVEKNRQHFRYKYVGAGATEHLFYAEPVNKNAALKVEAIDRFGNKYTEIPHEPNRKELETDVLDPDFEAIQKITAIGILQTTGEPFGWANRTWFYPDSTLSVEEFTKGLHSFDKKVKIMKSSKILTEKEAVLWITKAKNPFSEEIGFDGHLKYNNYEK
jgi:hypothetical protein